MNPTIIQAMLTDAQKKFLQDMAIAAKAAGHIFPEMAACEAAVESEWGYSYLYRQTNNVFGTKQHSHPIFGTLSLPTKEFIHNNWIVVNADWVKYPTLIDCFKDRMDTLKRLSGDYPHYEAALAARTPEEFVTEVSQSWSTGPDRARDCIAIYHTHQDLLDSALGG